MYRLKKKNKFQGCFFTKELRTSDQINEYLLITPYQCFIVIFVKCNNGNQKTYCKKNCLV